MDRILLQSISRNACLEISGPGRGCCGKMGWDQFELYLNKWDHAGPAGSNMKLLPSLFYVLCFLMWFSGSLPQPCLLFYLLDPNKEPSAHLTPPHAVSLVDSTHRWVNNRFLVKRTKWCKICGMTVATKNVIEQAADAIDSSHEKERQIDV